MLLGGGHKQRVYELTAPDTVNWQQLAELASTAAGKPIRYRPIIDAEATARARSRGIPEQYLDTVVGFYSAYRHGWCATPPRTSKRSPASRPPLRSAVRASEEDVRGIRLTDLSAPCPCA